VTSGMEMPRLEGRWPRCRLRVRGRMGPASTKALSGFRVSHEGDLSVIEGPLRPGNGLVTLLLEVQALGLEVVEIHRSDAPEST
jgi:hypothetical protein